MNALDALAAVGWYAAAYMLGWWSSRVYEALRDVWEWRD